jgi:transcriptional regulator with XRE-family HTH domain
MLDRDCVRMARLRLRLSQESLGKAIGQDQSYVSKIERGEITEITITTLGRLADALGVSTDALLGREDKDSEQLATAVELVEA